MCSVIAALQILKLPQMRQQDAVLMGKALAPVHI